MNRRNFFLAAILLCMFLFMGTTLIPFGYKEKLQALETVRSTHSALSDSCESGCKPSGSGSLPRCIVSGTTNLEMQSLRGSRLPLKRKGKTTQKSLFAIRVGVKQKELVNEIVGKFSSSEFVIMLFHYDGVVDEWRDMAWSRSVLHVSAINQTKWWFAKRFLHPDIVSGYKFIFLWDEDLGVDHFNPGRYLSVIENEGLEISQPALEISKSQAGHRITARWRKGDVHRWVEMMAPVFSRAAWHCVWHLLQNDLIHAWGLDMKLRYCAQGDWRKNVGVVDSEYLVHKGLPTLGGFHDEKVRIDLMRNLRFSR